MSADLIRFYEAWEIVPLPDGTREVADECGHLHDTLAEAKEHHKLSAGYNAIVGVEYLANGEQVVFAEHAWRAKRPRSGFARIMWDMVNA